MKKVSCLVLNNFTNDSRVLKEAISLAKSGFSVTIYALQDGLLESNELIEPGIRVERVFLATRNWPKYKPVQFVKWVEWMARVIWRTRRTNIIHSNDLNTLPVSIFAKLLSLGRKKVVYDTHEYAINDLPNESRLRIRIKYLIEAVFIRFADRVVTVSESIAQAYRKLYGIERPYVVLNCPNYAVVEKSDLLRKELGIGKHETIFLYQGGLTSGRGIERLLRVFGNLKESNMVVVFMGYGPLQKKIEETSSSSERIFWKKGVAPSELLKYTASADFGFSLIEDVCLSYRFCLPNKIFEYVMADIQVIVSDLPEMSRIVREETLGLVCNMDSDEAIVEAMQECNLRMQNNEVANLEPARQMFNWERQEEILYEIYQEL